ncbi:hypothetical protein DOK_17720 [gamma proteobacterium BDW918]|uniref:Chromosome partition protein Smc n=1 Tax=Zhongshania aliphaticivorans TaxID=1470434 RepID=A0A127MA69_9GAMM|nr:hypothetical protein [Zhongshania aliphaticivorans]AMO70120.1 hypothetical protein AZF00_18225 [Zhongshania aliphaticivorans]EIF41651.1 hypothetical protein DOK_17720 [gamma proteobacterium BDW918]
MLIFFLPTKQLAHAVLCVLCLAMVSAYTSYAYADISDTRAELERASERVVRAWTEYGELTGDAPSAEQIKNLRTYVANVADDQVAKTLDDVASELTSLEKEIMFLKILPSASNESGGASNGGLETLRGQFDDVGSRCSKRFYSDKMFQEVFNSSPCSEYTERFDNAIYHAENDADKVQAYEEGIASLTKIYRQVADLDTAELGRIHEKVKSFNARNAKLEALLEERQSLMPRINPLVEKMDEYKSKAESYIDDASSNCRAEGVDFDCGNRCQRRVRDPIFGTYRNEPDRRCLEKCNFQEQRATDDLNEQIEECIDERDWAKDKLEDIELDYKSMQSRVLALYDQYERVNDEIVSLADSNKRAVVELDQFLIQLLPEVFYAMNSEFSAYGVNSVSYRSD